MEYSWNGIGLQARTLHKTYENIHVFECMDNLISSPGGEYMIGKMGVVVGGGVGRRKGLYNLKTDLLYSLTPSPASATLVTCLLNVLFTMTYIQIISIIYILDSK